MAKQYYFPTSLLAQITLLKLFVTRFVTAYATKYGVSTTQMSDMAACAAYYDWLSQCHEAVNQYDHAMTEYMDTMMNNETAITHTLPVLTLPAAPATTPQPGGMGRFKSLVQGIKNNPIYSAEDGKNWGIEGAETTIDEDTMQPNLKADIVGLSVVISSPKQRMQGTEIWADKGSGYQMIGFCSGTKYTDPAALPATAAIWKYKGRYHLHGEAIGQYSDEIKVHVGG